jgi:hypothetical protein
VAGRLAGCLAGCGCAPLKSTSCCSEPSALLHAAPRHPRDVRANFLAPVTLQRFTFTPVDAKKAGETHPSVIPVSPVNGLKMYVA